MAAPFETFILENKPRDIRFEFRVFSGDQKVLVLRRSYVKSAWVIDDQSSIPIWRARDIYQTLRKQSYTLI